MIYIVCGPCGSGKSHYIRENFDADEVTVLDMADLRKEAISQGFGGFDTYYRSMSLLLDEIEQATGDVVVEGIFAPGSQSRSFIEHELSGKEYEFVDVFDGDVLICAGRILDDYRESVEKDEDRAKARLYLLVKYAPNWGETWL